jgi:hypothetical protein
MNIDPSTSRLQNVSQDILGMPRQIFPSWRDALGLIIACKSTMCRATRSLPILSALQL